MAGVEGGRDAGRVMSECQTMFLARESGYRLSRKRTGIQFPTLIRGTFVR